MVRVKFVGEVSTTEFPNHRMELKDGWVVLRIREDGEDKTVAFPSDRIQRVEDVEVAY